MKRVTIDSAELAFEYRKEAPRRAAGPYLAPTTFALRSEGTPRMATVSNLFRGGIALRQYLGPPQVRCPQINLKTRLTSQVTSLTRRPPHLGEGGFRYALE